MPLRNWPRLPILAILLAVTAVWLYLLWPRFFWIPVVGMVALLLVARRWEAAPLAAFALLVLAFYCGMRFGSWRLFGLESGFWYEVLYTLAVLTMGVRFIRLYRHRDRYMVLRTVFNMCSQLIVGFLLAFCLPFEWRQSPPGSPGNGLFLMYLFPLEINAVLLGKYMGLVRVVKVFLAYNLVAGLVVMPVLVYYLGRRPYCSWFCGCGCLAETLGDPFRRLTPRTRLSRRLEWVIYPVTAFALGLTVWVLATPGDKLASAMVGIHAYDLIVKFLLASLVGVGFYSLLGARIWCRYFCPWAGVFGVLAHFGRYAIRTRGELCMGCGMCNTYCEMGIDIRGHAMRGEPIKTTTCVGCGMCIEKCPRRVLSFTVE